MPDGEDVTAALAALERFFDWLASRLPFEVWIAVAVVAAGIFVVSVLKAWPWRKGG